MATDPYTQRKSGVLVPRGFSHAYESARPSVKRAWLPTVQTDSRKILTPTVLRVLRSKARHEYRNNGFLRGAIGDVARYLMGFDGIRPQWQTKDSGWNREMELRWANWLNICDVRRTLHGNQIFRSASIEMDVDGDFGILLTETGGGDTGGAGMAQIQTVRAHRIDDPKGATDPTAGVVEDRNGRTIGYNVTQADGDKTRFIPVESFILLGDPELSDWSRYPSAIAHGLYVLQDGNEVMGFVRDGIKNRTSRPFFHKTPTGDVEEDGDGFGDTETAGADENGAGGVAYQDLISGMIPRLGPGEEILELDGEFPGGMVIPILEFDMRAFACGYGVPLEMIWKSDVGGSSQRWLINKLQRKIDERRGMVFVPHLLRRLAGYFASKEMKRGAIRFNEEWWKIRWRPTSPNLTVDIGRDSKANLAELLYGNRTMERDVSETGDDWQELREQSERETDDLIERALRQAKKHNITFEQALNLLSQRSTGTTSLNLNELISPAQEPRPSKSAEPLDE